MNDPLPSPGPARGGVGGAVRQERICCRNVARAERVDDGIDAGRSSPVARQAHNLKVVGSNPTPAPN